MNNYNSMERCALILSSIISHKYHSSIFNIAKDYHLPIEVVRNDISQFINNNVIKYFIYFDVTDKHISHLIYNSLKNDIIKDDLDSVFEEFYNDDTLSLKISFGNVFDYIEDQKKGNIVKKVKSIITSQYGYLDNCIISFENNSFFTQYTPIPISDVEENLLKKEFPELINQKYRIKKTVWDDNSFPEADIHLINQCISNKHKLRFDYKMTSLKPYTICPVLIYYNTFENTAYCIDNDDYIFRIDKMYSIKETNIPYEISKINKNYDYLWGSPYLSNENVTHVVVQIINNTSNIIQKINHDTMYRKYRKLYYNETKDCYIYEDDIIGINNFKRWLRSYGSSLIVIEPLSLAKEMHQTALKVLMNYEKDN